MGLELGWFLLPEPGSLTCFSNMLVQQTHLALQSLHAEKPPVHLLIHTSRRVIDRYRHVGGVLFQVSASAGRSSTADRLVSHMMSAYARPAAKETVEEEEDLDAAGETNAGGGLVLIIRQV